MARISGRNPDCRVVYLTPTEARIAFERGEVDAWAIWAPWLTELVLSGTARVLRDASGLADNAVPYIASEAFAAEQPELVGVFFAQLAAVAASLAPHRLPQRVDDRLLAGQQAVFDAFHRHNLLGTMSLPIISPNGPVKLSSAGATARSSGSFGNSSSAVR